MEAENPMEFSSIFLLDILRSKLKGWMPCHEFEKKYTHSPPIDGHPGEIFVVVVSFFSPIFGEKKGAFCLGWELFLFGTLHNQGPKDVLFWLQNRSCKDIQLQCSPIDGKKTCTTWLYT